MISSARTSQRADHPIRWRRRGGLLWLAAISAAVVGLAAVSIWASMAGSPVSRTRQAAGKRTNPKSSVLDRIRSAQESLVPESLVEHMPILAASVGGISALILLLALRGFAGDRERRAFRTAVQELEVVERIRDVLEVPPEAETSEALRPAPDLPTAPAVLASAHTAFQPARPAPEDFPPAAETPTAPGPVHREASTPFFVPDAPDRWMADLSYAQMARNAQQATTATIKDRRIVRLEFQFRGQQQAAEVGQILQLNDELVFAILEADVYLVCTMNHGALRGKPVEVQPESILVIEEFRADDRPQAK